MNELNSHRQTDYLENNSVAIQQLSSYRTTQ